jgi:hypothetical protein
MRANVEDRPGSVSRTSQVFDGLLAAGLAAFLVVGTYFASQGQQHRRPFDAGAVALLVVAAGALAWRRRSPVPVLGVVFGAALVYNVLGYANGPLWLALIIAYFTAVVAGHRLAAAVVAVVGFGIFPWLDHLLRDQPGPSLVGIAGLAAWLLVLLGAAEAIRIRRERMAEAARIREEEARRRAGEERLRIARELHDALGHHLSLINMQPQIIPVRTLCRWSPAPASAWPHGGPEPARMANREASVHECQRRPNPEHLTAVAESRPTEGGLCPLTGWLPPRPTNRPDLPPSPGPRPASGRLHRCYINGELASSATSRR